MFLWTLVTKATINKQDYIKLKSFCTGKETIDNNKKRQPTGSEKVFTNDISNKELIPKTHKEFIQLHMGGHGKIYLGGKGRLSPGS